MPPKALYLRMTCEAAGVENCGVEIESGQQFLFPLFTQACRADDHRLRVGPPVHHLGNHQRRLDGLAQSDCIGDQKAAAVSTRESHCRLELKWE